MIKNRWLILLLINLFPPTRFYKTKAFLLRLSGINIHSSARIVSSVKIWGSDIHIGSDTFIGHGVLVTNGDATISIGANVDIAPNVTIVSGTHKITPWESRTAGIGYAKNIIIEDGVWIGVGAIVTGGVCIGKNALIGAGALILSDIPAGAIAVGIPARVVKQWDFIENIWI